LSRQATIPRPTQTQNKLKKLTKPRELSKEFCVPTFLIKNSHRSRGGRQPTLRSPPATLRSPQERARSPPAHEKTNKRVTPREEQNKNPTWDKS